MSNKKNTKSENDHDITAILDRFYQLIGSDKQKDIAKLLGILPQDVSNRKKRGTLRKLIVNWLDENRHVDSEWLLYGTSPKPNDCVCEETDHYDSEQNNVVELQHIDVIKNFIDKPKALEINKALSELEKIDMREYYEICGMIKQALSNAKRKALTDRAGPDRRVGERRKKNDPDGIPGGNDRRTGSDRRQVAGK